MDSAQFLRDKITINPKKICITDYPYELRSILARTDIDESIKNELKKLWKEKTDTEYP